MRKAHGKKSVKTQKQFGVIIEQGLDGYFVASVPALPGCHTQGKSLEEVKQRIREAISLCLEVAREDSEYKARIKNFAYEPASIGFEIVRI